MVRIPLPQEPQRVPGRNGFVAPGVAAPGDVAGAQAQQLGRAALGAGLAVSQRAAELEERLNIAAVKKGQALAEERIVDADRAYTNLLGAAATKKGRERAWADLQQELQKVEKGLEHGVQRNLFRQVVGRRLTSLRARWNEHEDKQSFAAEMGGRQAVLKSKINLARQLGPGPEAEEALRAVKAEARGIAQMSGAGPEETDGFVLDKTTELHSGIIEDLVEQGHTTRAREYLTNAEKEISAERLHDVRRLVRQASVADEGLRHAIKIRNGLEEKHRERLRNPNRTEAMPLALPADDLLVRGTQQIRALMEKGTISREEGKAAFNELERMVAEREIEETQAKEQVLDEAEKWLRDNPTDNVGTMPGSIKQRLEMFGLTSVANKFATSDHRYTTDPHLFSELFVPGNALLKMKLPQFRLLMRGATTPDDFAKAMVLWREANEQTTPADFTFLGPMQRLKEEAERNDIDPKKDAEQFKRFLDEVQSRINAWQGDTGKKISQDPQQMDRIFGEVLSDPVFRRDTLLGIDFLNPDNVVPFALLSPEEQREAYVRVGTRTVKLGGLGGITSAETTAAMEMLAEQNAKRAKKKLPPRVMTKQLLAETVLEIRGEAPAGTAPFNTNTLPSSSVLEGRFEELSR